MKDIKKLQKEERTLKNRINKLNEEANSLNENSIMIGNDVFISSTNRTLEDLKSIANKIIKKHRGYLNLRKKERMLGL